MSITVVIVDDRQLFREGVALLLSTQIDLAVVAEAGDVESACAAMVAHAPKVAVVAQELTGGAGVAATRELVRRHPALRVVIAAAIGDEVDARHALAAGAHGYLLKSQASTALFDAIRTVARGEVYLPPLIAAARSNWREARVSDGTRRPMVRRAGSAAGDGTPLQLLSARERQVFGLLVRGHTNASIGRLLGISAKTVDTHRTKVLRKIGVHSVVDLVRFAARNQLPLD